MRTRRFARALLPDDAVETDLSVWSVPARRTCRGVQLVHVGQVCTCLDDSCPDPAGTHTVSFRCTVMASPCPSCGARAWGPS